MRQMAEAIRPTQSVRAIVRQSGDGMLHHLDIYRNPETRFEVTTWSGQCVLTPLALAVEEPGLIFETVLDVLVRGAHIDPSAPYVIIDLSQGLCIRTNALTHLLARWDSSKYEKCREGVLKSLMAAGANAMAPALYEVTPLEDGRGEIPPYERALSAASGQSLLAFQMSQDLHVPTPFYFITDLIKEGHARFLPADPPGLFVRFALDPRRSESIVQNVIDFLCPSAESPPAHGELCRIVHGMDLLSGWNALHLFVARGNVRSIPKIQEQLRMLKGVYGLSLLTHTLDGQDVTALAAASRAFYATQMQAAVQDELRWPRAMLVARKLHDMPSLPMHEIEKYTGLPLLEAQARYQLRRPL